MVTVVTLPTLEHAFYWRQKAQECRDLVEAAGGLAQYLLTLGPNTKNAMDLALKYEQEYQKIMAQFGATGKWTMNITSMPMMLLADGLQSAVL